MSDGRVLERITSPRDLLMVLFRHRYKAALCTLAVISATVLYAIYGERSYISEAKVFLRLGRENVMLDAMATVGTGPVFAVPPSREGELISAEEILKSREAAMAVVKDVGADVILGVKPEAESGEPTQTESSSVIDQFFAFVDQLKELVRGRPPLEKEEIAMLAIDKGLQIDRAPNSSVIQVSFKSADPRRSQVIVGSLVDAFMDQHIQLTRSEDAPEFLKTQKERFQTALEAAEDNFIALKDRTGLVSVADQRRSLVEQIGRLEDVIRTVSAELVATSSEAESLTMKLDDLPDQQITSRVDGVANEATDGIRQQLYTLQMREQELEAKLKDQHPSLIQIREQLRRSKEILDQEETSRTEVTTGISEGYQQILLATLRLRSTEMALKAKSETLARQLVQAREELAKLNENEIQISRAERDLQLLEADYRKYSAALEQARIDEALGAEKISNVRVVQHASFEPKPVSPKLGLMAVGGLALAVGSGFLLAFAMEWLDHTFRTPDDVEQTLGVAVLTDVPKLKSDPLKVLAAEQSYVH